MKCVVTGGSGFIGHHVVQALAAAGHQVTNIDLHPPPAPGGQYVKADIQDAAAMADICRNHGQDAVFHVAAVANARESLEDPIKTIEVNIRGTACILEAARRAGTKRVILASTVWYYNATDPSVTTTSRHSDGIRWLDEREPISPKGGGHIYTTSKIAAELLCNDYHRLYGLDFTILRYGIPYGPGMWPGLVLRSFLDNAFSGKPIRIHGDGSAVRRFLYVGDIANAHVLCLSDVAKNQTYNLEGQRDVTVKELAELIRRFVPSVEIEYVIDASRRGELKIEGTAISNQKAKDELNWSPTTELEAGVTSVVDWYKQHVLNAS